MLYIDYLEHVQLYIPAISRRSDRTPAELFPFPRELIFIMVNIYSATLCRLDASVG